jgi:hypothetical protein
VGELDEVDMGKQTAEDTTTDDSTTETKVDEVVDKSIETKTDTTDQDGETPNDQSVSIEDEVVVTIGDEAPPKEDEEIAKAPEWVRDLRKSQRELIRKNKELERQLAEKAQPNEATDPGKKPAMADADIDYDADKFEVALTKWNEKRRAADNESAQRQAAEKQSQEAWQKKLSGYGEAKTQLKVKDFDDSESAVLETMNVTQQGIIIQGADNAALVIYALGKNLVKLKELASITDPVKFAFAIAKLEKDLKVTTRKAPPPEKTVNGSAPKSGVVDSQLDWLRADAEKSGDYTKVTQYKQQRRRAAS